METQVNIDELLARVARQPQMRGVHLQALTNPADVERRRGEPASQNRGWLKRKVFGAKADPLAEYLVVMVRAPSDTLQAAAENLGLYKKITPTGVTDAEIMPLIEEFGLWRPFIHNRRNEYERSANPDFFTEAEILYLLCGILCKSADGEDSPLLDEVAEGRLFVMALADDAIRSKARQNSQILIRREDFTPTVQVPEAAEYVGAGASLYFVFMRSYLKWLRAPAVLSLVCSALLSTGILPEASSQAHAVRSLYVVVISVWATAFIAAWRHQVAVSSHQLGEDTAVDNPEKMFDQAKFYKMRQTQAGTSFSRIGFATSTAATVFVLFVQVIVWGLFFTWLDGHADKYQNVFVQKLPELLFAVVTRGGKVVFTKIAEYLVSMENRTV
jgi:hypothetical protein